VSRNFSRRKESSEGEYKMEQLEAQQNTRKTPPKGTPERREYDRDQKRKSREKQKLELEAKQVFTAQECFDKFFGSPEFRRVHAFAKEQHSKISQELGFDEESWSRHPAFYDVDAVLITWYGFKENFVRRVTEPQGIRVSGLIFPDVIGKHIVAASHRYGLESSPTFKELYRELLRTLDKRFGKKLSGDPVERQSALDVKAELAGTYQLAVVA
jgi:hypothetical protein